MTGRRHRTVRLICSEVTLSEIFMLKSDLVSVNSTPLMSLFLVESQCFLNLKYSSCDIRYLSRNVKSFWKRSWIPSKFFFMHLFLQVWAFKGFICSSVFPWRLPWGRTFWMTWFRSKRISNCHRWIRRLELFSQEMPTSVINDALIPVKKAFWALYFRNCLAQLK